MTKFTSISLAVLAACAMHMQGSDDSGTVHEWGTFTSVAGEDGSAMSWESLSGPADLPCFVHRLDQRNLKAAAYGTVRMETPVIYFYPLKPMTLSVHVAFPNGRVTEWYPRASSVQPSASRKGWIEWNEIQVNQVSEPLPTSGVASHYYAARDTEAWPVTTGGETEKLLFYRGIANLSVDLRPVVHADDVLISNAGAESIPEAILFENHAGHIAYRVIRGLNEPVVVKFSDLSGTLQSVRSELEDDLTEMGLYRKEAHAMLETWRDSWFEEGLRVFYIVPRAKVDTLLPISIDPAPLQLERVFVGRVELLSPQTKEEITAALKNGDIDILKKYGRFLNAFVREISGPSGEPEISDRATTFLNESYSQALAESRKTSCK